MIETESSHELSLERLWGGKASGPLSGCSLSTINMRAMIVVLYCVVAGCSSDDTTIKPFTSDGCSAFPNGTLQHNNLWLACCEAHDLAYWKGGVQQARLNADIALKQCVASVGEPHIAQLMLAGVRVGGSPYLPTKFRWGYGWFWPRGYRKRSDAENLQIEQLEK